LKDSDYSEVDRAECQFTTTGTVLDNGTQVCSFLSIYMSRNVKSYFPMTRKQQYCLIDVDSPSGKRLSLLYSCIQSSIFSPPAPPSKIRMGRCLCRVNSAQKILIWSRNQLGLHSYTKYDQHGLNVILGKIQCPHRGKRKPEMNLLRVGTPCLINRFCKDKLSPI
jgi:hypothetical protein